MNLDDLLKRARELWPEATTEQEMAIAMGVIYGDICRYVRDHSEGKRVNDEELKKEMGNVIFSMVRWMDDRGFGAETCLNLAIAANEQYVKRKTL